MLDAIKTSLVSDRPHFESALELLAKAKQLSPSGTYFTPRDLTFY
jgi:hypothetical protein